MCVCVRACGRAGGRAVPRCAAGSLPGMFRGFGHVSARHILSTDLGTPQIQFTLTEGLTSWDATDTHTAETLGRHRYNLTFTAGLTTREATDALEAETLGRN